MGTPWRDIWGCGRGPARRLAPQSRIAAGAILFAACLTVPTRTAAGVALAMATSLGWTAACGMPRRVFRSFAVLGLAMFLPYFLLVPLGPAGLAKAGPIAAAWVAAWDVFVRGLAGMFISAATATSLSQSDLRRGLLALPVPRALAAILLQIVHQTGEMIAETDRMAAAVAVRGGSGRRKGVLRALVSLPRVWFPRILDRAERVAAAMEVRGYAAADLRAFGRPEVGWTDAVALAAILGVLVLAAALRWSARG